MAATIPSTVDRKTFQEQIDQLRIREKAHTREGDALAAARRRLPMVEVDATTPLIGGANGTTVTLLDAFEGRTQLFASYHMWYTGLSAAEQCEGCTFNTGQALELSYLHARDVTFAVFCQGPFNESNRYREFMGWENMPWYSVPEASYSRLAMSSPRPHVFGMKACYLRDGDRVFETYWTTGRGCERMSGSYGMLDMTVYGRKEAWEDSPPGWPRQPAGEEYRTEEGETVTTRAGIHGRPTSQWSRLASGRDDDLGTGPTKAP